MSLNGGEAAVFGHIDSYIYFPQATAPISMLPERHLANWIEHVPPDSGTLLGQVGCSPKLGVTFWASLE